MTDTPDVTVSTPSASSEAVPAAVEPSSPEIAEGLKDIASSLFPDAEVAAKGTEEGEEEAPASTPDSKLPATKDEPAAASADAPPATDPTTITLEMPRQWKAGLKEDFAKLPRTVQEEIIRREDNMFTGIETYKGNAKQWQDFTEANKDILPILQQYGINPIHHATSLFRINHVLAMGSPDQKVQQIRAIMKDYGVPLESLGLAASDGSQVDPALLDPQVAALQTSHKELESKLDATQRQLLQDRREKLLNEVTALAQDKKTYPHFEAVGSEIAKLLKAGLAKTVPEAYQQAIWNVPEVREQLLQEQISSKIAATQAEDKKRADAARKATAANVVTSSKANRGAAAPGKAKTLDETLEATYAEIQSRSK